ncbi:hypothetical protein I553_2864 [Mycobacterium xenopi 4042]|uniref:Uncharacterized protein n=1 Tax=Mycobacterium xenopi 4042 TaxID=1299334 RepID=X8EDA5_MYCXE|nr:hypothetical protein I553_2864 [Mycobacterium xenopi 4042]
MLLVAAVGRGSAGLAILGAAAAVGDLTIDRRVVGAVVARVEEHDHAGDVGRDRGRGRDRRRRHGDEHAGADREPDTQANSYAHRATVARGRLG